MSVIITQLNMQYSVVVFSVYSKYISIISSKSVSDKLSEPSVFI